MTKDGYRIWNPSQRKVICSHDVIFKPEVTCNIRNEIEVTETEQEEKDRDEEQEEETTDEETEDESFKSVEEGKQEFRN